MYKDVELEQKHKVRWKDCPFISSPLVSSRCIDLFLIGLFLIVLFCFILFVYDVIYKKCMPSPGVEPGLPKPQSGVLPLYYKGSH